MITFKREKGSIKIFKNEKRIYTVAEKAYACLVEIGLGGAHVINMIEQIHETKLHHEDIKKIKDFLQTI